MEYKINDHEINENTQLYPDSNNVNDVNQQTTLPTQTKSKSTSKTRNKIFIIVGVIIIVSLVLFIVISSQSKNKAENYQKNLKTAAHTMLSGAIQAESCGNLTYKVWYNSIYEERNSETDAYTRPNGYFVSDFNIALQNLFDDTEYQSKIESIKSNRTEVQNLIKELNDPPKEYEDAYSSLLELYDAYIDLTNIAISPSGSLQTYSSDFSSADSTFSNCFDTISIYTK